MDKKDQSSQTPSQSKTPESFLKNAKGKKANSKFKAQTESSNQEVLIKVGGFEYKTPGRRQRIIIASIVLGLNLLLVCAVALYFYSPSFQQFIYSVGRN